MLILSCVLLPFTLITFILAMRDIPKAQANGRSEKVDWAIAAAALLMTVVLAFNALRMAAAMWA